MRHTLPLRARRHLFIEALEDRQLLAGNVTAAIDGNVLLVTGDDLSNNLIIAAGPNAGEITITGGKIPGQANSETTVNGQLSPVTLAGFGGEVQLSMQGGDDQVLITRLVMEGSLQALLGAGNDFLSIQSNGLNDADVVPNDGSAITFGPAKMGVFVSVDGGDGNDTLSLRNAQVNGYLAFTGGSGNDTFAQAGAAPANNRLGGSLTLNMNSGSDTVRIQRLEIPADLLVNDGVGPVANVRIDAATVAGVARIITPNTSDTISLGVDTLSPAFVAQRLVVNANRGYDQISLTNVDVKDLVVHAGAGNNTVSLTHVSADNSLTLTGAEGADKITLSAVFTSALSIRTWAGNDKVTIGNVAASDAVFNLFDGADELVIADSIFDQLTALFGLDDDKLTFGDLTVIGTATFDGGDGLNTSTNLGGNSIGRLRLINFAS